MSYQNQTQRPSIAAVVGPKKEKGSDVLIWRKNGRATKATLQDDAFVAYWLDEYGEVMSKGIPGRMQVKVSDGTFEKLLEVFPSGWNSVLSVLDGSATIIQRAMIRWNSRRRKEERRRASGST